MKLPITQKGIGIIEVLITTLVVALGLLAVASLQGNLMGSSAANKTRSEAKSLCENRLEQLRDPILQGATTSTTASEFNGLGMASPAVVTGTAPARTGVTTETGITGTNETFTRVTTVTELSNPTRKQISIVCSWGNADVDHQFTVQGIVSFDNASYSNKIADNAANPPSGLNVGSPTTNAGSSTVITDSTTVAITGGTPGALVSTTPNSLGQYIKATTTTQGSYVYKCTGETAVGVTPFIPYIPDLGLYTRRIHFQPSTTTFVEAIELAYSNDDALFGTGQSSCTRKVRYNGGVIIPIKGRIYSNASLSSSVVSLLGFDASESGVFCKFSSNGLSATGSVPYFCYVGGNCVNGPAGTIKEDTTNVADSNGLTGVAKAIAANVTATAGQNTIVTQCPTYAASGDTSYPTNVYSSVGPGGWRGNVGVIGLGDTQSSQTYTTCFSPVATARQYYSLRNNSSVLTNEGINKSYMCHDFLVISPPNNSATYPGYCAPLDALSLAANPVVRNFSGTTANTFDTAVNTANCHVISGTVPTGVTKVGATTTNGSFDCTVTGTNYSCTGTSKASSVTVTAIAGGTGSCALTLTNSNLTPTCNVSASTGVTPRTVYGVITEGTGVSFGTGPGKYNPVSTAGLLTFSDASCTASKSGSRYSYTCTSVPSNTTLLFNASSGFVTNPATIAVGSANITTPAGDIVISTGTSATYALTTSAGTGGSIVSPASGTAYPAVSSVTVTAQANSGYTISGWNVSGATISSGCTATSYTCTVTTINGSQSVTANFAAIPTYTIKGSIAPGTATISGVSGTNSANCSLDAGSTTAYTCTVASGWTGSVSATGTCSSGTFASTFAVISTGVTGDLTGQNVTASCTVSYTVSGTISYSSATAADWLSISSPCSFTPSMGSATGYTCTVTSGTALTVTVGFTDGTLANNRYVCIGSTVYTTTGATIYTGTVTANVTQNITLKKSSLASCP